MGAQQSNGSGTGRPDSGIGLDFRGASSPTLKRAFPAPPIGYTPSGDAVLERLSRGPDGRFRLRSEEDSPQKFTVQCVPVQNPLRFLGDMDSPRSTYDFSNSIKGLPPTTNSPFIPSVCTDSEDSDDAESRNEVTETQQFGFPRTPERATKGVGTTLGKLAPLERRGVDDEERNSDGTGFMAFLEELVGHAETLDDASSVGSAATTYGFDTGTDSGRRPSEDSFGRRTSEISRNTTREILDWSPPATDDVPRMCDSSSQTESSSGQSGMANRRDTAHSSSSNSSYSGFGEDDASPRGARMSFEADDTGADGSCDDSDSDDGYIEMNVRSRPTSQLQPDPDGSAMPAPQGSPKSIRQWPAAVGREGVRLTVMEERVDKMHRQVQSSQDRLAAWLKAKDTGVSKKAQLDANSNPTSNPNPAIPAAAAAGNRRPTGTRRRLPTKPTCTGRTLPTPPNTKLVMPHRPGPSMYEKKLLLQAALSTH